MKTLAIFVLDDALLARLTETILAYQSVRHRERDAIAEIIVARETAVGLRVVSGAIRRSGNCARAISLDFSFLVQSDEASASQAIDSVRRVIGIEAFDSIALQALRTASFRVVVAELSGAR